MNRLCLSLLILLQVSTLQAQRYEVSPGEYYNLWLDKSTHTAWQINGNAQAIPDCPIRLHGGGRTHHEAFLDDAGNVYTLGDNHDGELGIGNTDGAEGPQRVSTDNKGHAFGNVVTARLRRWRRRRQLTDGRRLL